MSWLVPLAHDIPSSLEVSVFLKIIYTLLYHCPNIFLDISEIYFIMYLK